MAKKPDIDPFVKYVIEEFERYEMHHRDRYEKCNAIYKLWKNDPPKKDLKWQNSVCVPMMVEAEQTVTPRLFTALFPSDAPLDVLVEGDTPSEQGIRIKGLLQHYFRIADVQGESWSTLTQTTLFGTGYLEGGSWYVRRAWQIDPETGEPYNAIVENRPDCAHVSFFEMFPHPDKKKIGDGLPLIRRRFCDAEFLKRLQDNPNWDTKKLIQALESDTTEVNKENEYDAKKREKYEILEYWGPWDTSYTKNDNTVVAQRAIPWWGIVINRRVAIRSIRNPFNHQREPYIKTILFKDPKNDWFGIGIGQIGKSGAERINKIVNQRLDNVDLVINKPVVYNGNDVLLSRKKLGVSKPGLLIKASDVNTSVKFLDTPDVTASSYKEEELAKQDFRQATGATAHLQPAESPQHRTAMGIQLLQGAAGMRFRPVLRKLELDFIQQLAMFFFSNLRQFMTDAEWILITGKNGETKPIQVTPEQIQAKVFFVPTGISETMNKEVQVGQLLRYKEITMNDPTVNRQEINRRIAELFGFKDIGKLLTPMQMPQMNGLSNDDQQVIQQRLAEGASPQQIRSELAGPRPSPQPQGATNAR